jgi:hypothetical protein
MVNTVQNTRVVKPASVNPLEEFRLGMMTAGGKIDRTYFLFESRTIRLETLTARLASYCRQLRITPFEYGKEAYTLAATTPFFRPSISNLLGPSLFQKLKATLFHLRRQQARQAIQDRSRNIAHGIVHKVVKDKTSPDCSILRVQKVVEAGCDPVIALLSQRYLISPVLLLLSRDAMDVWVRCWGFHSQKFCGISINEAYRLFPQKKRLEYIRDDALREWFRSTYCPDL